MVGDANSPPLDPDDWAMSSDIHKLTNQRPEMGLTDQSEAREPPCGGEINHPSQEPSASDGPETVRR